MWPFINKAEAHTQSHSFCEPVWAGPKAKLCIRKLSSQGKKLGGGVDTSSFCGRVNPRQNGWDLEAEIPSSQPDDCCAKCWLAYKEEISSNV